MCISCAELRRLFQETDPSRSRPGTPALRRHHNGPPRLTSRPEQHPQPPPRTTPTPCRETAPTRGDRGRSAGAAPGNDCGEGNRGRRRSQRNLRKGLPTQAAIPLTDPPWQRPPRGAVPRCRCVYSPARLPAWGPERYQEKWCMPLAGAIILNCAQHVLESVFEVASN